MTNGLVDAVFVMAPVGDKTTLDLMKGGPFRLLPIAGWSEGSAPLRISLLRAAHCPSLKDYLLEPHTARVARHNKCSVQIVRS